MLNGLITVGNLANTAGVLVQKGGTLTTKTGANALVAGSGTNGIGVFEMDGGVANIGNELFFGYGPNNADLAMTSYGAMIMVGGTLNHGSYFGLGRGQTGNAAGTAYMKMTGGLVQSVGTTNPFQIGAYQGARTNCTLWPNWLAAISMRLAPSRLARITLAVWEIPGDRPTPAR